MSKEEFKTLLNRIDEISKETHIEDTIITAVSSITNYFNPQSKSAEAIPIQAIILYLEEKGLTEYLKKIETKYSENISAQYLAADIIVTLKSVVPEQEITLERTENIEEELIDENLNDDIIEFDKKNTGDYIVEDGEIFEVVEDEVEIPNHEILSGDDINEFNEEITEVLESKDFDQHIISEEENVLKKEENEKKIEEDEINRDQSIYEDEKKKPESSELFRKLIDINPIYESILPEITPFNGIYENESYIEFTDDLSDECDYQIDQSCLKEEIFIINEEIKTKDSKNIEESIMKDIEKEHKKSDLQLIEPEENIEKTFKNKTDSLSGIDDNIDNMNIDSTIDNVVNAEIDENYSLNEDKAKEIENFDSEEKQHSVDLKDAEKKSLLEKQDEEITEVFTDLAFLDKEEEDFEVKEVLEDDNISCGDTEKLEHSLFNETTEDHFDSFSKMLACKDMTKIIEFIFDYDMEDYHSIVNNISKAENEDEGFNYTEIYCKQNRIEISSKEVTIFKAHISEYFAQAYS